MNIHFHAVQLWHWRKNWKLHKNWVKILR